MDYTDFIKEIDLLKSKKPILFELERDKAVSEDEIVECEKKYGLSFPDSYKKILMEFGGGYIGYIIMYSLDKKGLFNLKNYVSNEMIDRYNMLPVIDLETGDYIGFDIENNICTEKLVIFLHEDNNKKVLNMNFYELLLFVGLNNQSLKYK
jgi:hypothetical protein